MRTGGPRGASCDVAKSRVAGDVGTLSGRWGHDAVRVGEDVATRFGGGGVALILVSTKADSAMARAQRLCAAVEDLRLANPWAPGGLLTSSVGMALASPGRVTIRASIPARANRALYRAKAKAQGRNQVVLEPEASDT